MNKYVFDDNGIWSTPHSRPISFPADGYMNCLKLEESSFWFQHRNEIIYSLTQRFPFQNHFADIGGGNGCQFVFLANRYPEKMFFLIEPGYAGCLNAKHRGLSHIYNMLFQDFAFDEKKIGAIGLF